METLPAPKWFHRGQIQIWNSRKQEILNLAGNQSGKTVAGVHWLDREIQQLGPGDYLVASPTFTLMSQKVLPEFKKLFERDRKYGRLMGGTRPLFLFHDGETRVLFGHAQDPHSLESSTVKAAWLDEAGQPRFKVDSFEVIQERLAVNRGRLLITTKPYCHNWLKTRLYDEWEKAKRNHARIDVIQFDCLMNPAYPQEEYERARQVLPRWKFDLFYRAVFAKPAGLIYDCFDDRHRVPRFAIPDHWPRYLGIDFGGVNTAAVFLAEEVEEVAGPAQRFSGFPVERKSGRLYVYREYLEGGRTAAEHARAFRAGEPVRIPLTVGGSKSEGQWRQEFRAAGLPVREPRVSEVEVGIQRVYAAIKSDELFVFEDLHGLLDEIGNYSREVDEDGEPTEKIAEKESFHRLDSLRYVMSWARGGANKVLRMPGGF
jgi:hypothetical protein